MPCVAEFPQLERLYGREKELGFKFFGLEVKGLLAKMRDVVKEKKTTFPILLDDRRLAREVLQIPGTPTIFIVDGQGRIRARLFGAAEDIDGIIAEVLRKI
ncbi:MAG: TlpA disulfide reductase family protein [Candidatus Krumholzibacteria bacterium]|nr:TlpA disulfide reductase family protein [Candidatus Krumholzibacteria bacterium]